MAPVQIVPLETPEFSLNDDHGRHVYFEANWPATGRDRRRDLKTPLQPLIEKCLKLESIFILRHQHSRRAVENHVQIGIGWQIK